MVLMLFLWIFQVFRFSPDRFPMVALEIQLKRRARLGDLEVDEDTARAIKNSMGTTNFNQEHYETI